MLNITIDPIVLPETLGGRFLKGGIREITTLINDVQVCWASGDPTTLGSDVDEDGNKKVFPYKPVTYHAWGAVERDDQKGYHPYQVHAIYNVDENKLYDFSLQDDRDALYYNESIFKRLAGIK